MMKIFKSFGGYIELNQAEKGCWINVVNPDLHEIAILQQQFQIPDDILQDILDVDERPRIEIDDEWSLLIIRVPVPSPSEGIPFHTVPLGVFITEDYTITICSADNEVLPYQQPSLYREHYQHVNDTTNFILRLFLNSAKFYLKYLKQIYQQVNVIEKDLEKSIRNKELHRLLKMEKCLVFFLTSLKSNEIVLAKFKSSKMIRLSEVNEDLLEDATIENKQAADTAQIYSDIQAGLMDSFASVISNNLNVVLKRLTSVSIILMIPTLIASIFGMNIPNYMENNLWAFPGILLGSFLMSYLGVFIFRKLNWF
jgi:magnesium transporter